MCVIDVGAKELVVVKDVFVAMVVVKVFPVAKVVAKGFLLVAKEVAKEAVAMGNGPWSENSCQLRTEILEAFLEHTKHNFKK